MTRIVYTGMEHAEYVYTTGMSEGEVEALLRAKENGVLGLAHNNDAYAVPLSFHYDGIRLLLRVSYHDEQARKKQYLESTNRATFVLYNYDAGESWSILVQGMVTRLDETVTEAQLNEWFPPFRLFDEAIESVGFELYELELNTVIGRKTTGL